MGFATGKQGTPITGINVTPLVDITLVLLIIFMVTAKLVVSRAMPMDLPRAATGGEVQEIFSLALEADGTTHVDGDAVPDDATLLARAKAAQQRNQELRAVVRADGGVPHRRVMHALDVLRQAGVARIAFAVAQGDPVEAGQVAR
jgi:biopolymer transport protein ExbD